MFLLITRLRSTRVHGISMTTLSSGVLHTSLVMTVWHHMAGIFIRIHHRHRHQRHKKKQNSVRRQRMELVVRNHFNRVGSRGAGFVGFLGVRWIILVRTCATV